MHCNLQYSFDKERFLKCVGVGGRTCKTCGHSYMYHFRECAENREITEQQFYLDETAKAKYEAAKNMKEKKELLLAMLSTKQDEFAKQMKLLSDKLLLTMEEFHQLALINSYMRVLESQINIVKHRVQAADVSSDDKGILHNMLTELDKKLQLARVNDTLKNPQSEQADKRAQKAWAYTILNIDTKDHGLACLRICMFILLCMYAYMYFVEVTSSTGLPFV